MLSPSEVDEFLRRQRLLVIAPHADDEVIGAGGLIARIKAAGGSVFVLIVSIGDLEHFDSTGSLTMASTREQELKNAMDVLKVDGFEILFRDSQKHLRLETLPRRDLTTLFEKEAKLSIEKVKPTMICLPFPSFNQDHEAVYKAGFTACRPYLHTMKAFQNIVLIADAPQLAWGYTQFKPNFYVDISDFLNKKIEAYKCHKSQVRPSPHLASAETLRLLAEWRGREISTAAAEAFECIRIVL